MRIFIGIVTVCFLTTSLNGYGQYCQKLDSLSFFKSIKFGDYIPADIAEKGPGSFDYFLTYDNLNREFKRKYSDLFKFFGTRFSKSHIGLNYHREILFISLSAPVNFIDSVDFANSEKLPDEFIKFCNKVISLLQEPTRIEDNKQPEPIINKAIGISRSLFWEGYHMRLQVQLNYGCTTKELNNMFIYLTDKDFDKPPEELKKLE